MGRKQLEKIESSRIYEKICLVFIIAYFSAVFFLQNFSLINNILIENFNKSVCVYFNIRCSFFSLTKKKQLIIKN